MKKFYIITLLCFFSFTIQSSDQQLPHAFISDWKPGSYGSYTSPSKQSNPLPTWVWIQFDQKITDEKANQFLDFLKKSLQVLDRSAYHQPIKNKPETYCIVVQSFITKEQLQLFIDKANKQFDPTFKTVQEIAVLQTQADLQKKETIFVEQQKIFAEEKRKFEESQRAIAEDKRRLDAEKNIIEAEKNRLKQEKIKQQNELEQLKSISTPQVINQQTNINIKPQNNKKQTGFQPIADEARRNFIEHTLPSIQEDFAGLGRNSSGLQHARENATKDFENQLAALEYQYNLQQDFQPFQDKANEGYQQGVASLAERFTSLGGERLGSPAFTSALEQSNRGFQNDLNMQQRNIQNANQQDYNQYLYNNKLRQFIDYIPTLANQFTNLTNARLGSPSFKNALIQAGRNAGLLDRDITTIINQRFKS